MRLHFPSLPFRLPGPFSGQGLSLFPERSGSPVRRIVWLAVWGVVVFSVCLGSRLASERFAQALRQGLPPETGLVLRVDDVAPLAFPPGASATTLTLSDADGNRLVRLADGTVRVSLLSLLTGRLGVSVTGAVGDGELDATLASGFLFNTSAFKVELDLAALPLAEVPALARFDKNLQGTANGSARFAAAMDSLLIGDLRVDLAATGLNVRNFVPLLKPDRLPVMDVRLVAQASDGLLDVEEFDAVGEEMRISGQGQAAIDPDQPKATKLDFGARLRMPASLVIRQLIRPEDYKRLNRGEELGVQLTGTLDRPRIDSR